MGALDRTALVRSNADGSVTWWTSGELHANAGITARLGPMLGGQRVDNFAIPLVKGTTSEDVSMFTATVDPEADVPSWSVNETAKGLKFADCLPTEIARRVVDARLTDPAGIAAVVDAPSTASPWCDQLLTAKRSRVGPGRICDPAHPEMPLSGS